MLQQNNSVNSAAGRRRIRNYCEPRWKIEDAALTHGETLTSGRRSHVCGDGLNSLDVHVDGLDSHVDGLDGLDVHVDGLDGLDVRVDGLSFLPHIRNSVLNPEFPFFQQNSDFN